MSVSTFTTPGSGNWVADATEADIECWGSGGKGGNAVSGQGYGGGGGGEYAFMHVTGLVIGISYPYTVGTLGSASTFNGTIVKANGGMDGTTSLGAIGGTGGTGTILRPGGNGGNGGAIGGTGGGGGGGSGGTAANGNNGSPSSGMAGGAGAAAVTGGGAGGTGGTAAGASPITGFAPGGGGGAGGGGWSGANGATGQVRITTSPVTGATTLSLSLSVLPKRTSFEPLIVQGFTLSPSLSIVKFESSQLAAGTPFDLNLELSTLPPVVSPDFRVSTGTLLALTLSTLPKRANAELSFGITLGLTLSTLPKKVSFTSPVVFGTLLVMSLSTRQRLDPAIAFQYGTTITLTSLSVLPRSSGQLFPYFVNPNGSATKYVQAQKSGVEQIIFGVHSPFLLAKAGNNYRRRGKQQIIHTGKVKPEVKEIDAVFTILTLTGAIQPGEFHYESHDGYLRIVNPNVIDAMLIADGDNAAIDVQPTKVDIRQGVFFTTFHQ